jgi:glutathione synthase/RimK-type ligase-like ATP-grasp enzyme
MSKRVLILCKEDDWHALAIQALLRKRRAEADLLDTSKFPTELTLIHQGTGMTDVQINGRRLSDYHSIWNRRAHRPIVGTEFTDPDEKSFVERECFEALWGALYASGLPIYNRPDAERRASFKADQLRLAREIGLNIPQTLITNSPEAARAFYEAHNKRVIYKAFTGTMWRMMDTRPLEESDLADLWRVQYSPLIFQEFLELGREYRVSIVEDRCFAGEIVIEHPGAQYDWRLDDNHGVKSVTLPSDVEEKLQTLRRRLNLHSGAIDLRETPDGTIYYLEINPTGQFLFLDIFGKIDVAGAFCDMLLQ